MPSTVRSVGIEDELADAGLPRALILILFSVLSFYYNLASNSALTLSLNVVNSNIEY